MIAEMIAVATAAGIVAVTAATTPVVVDADVLAVAAGAMDAADAISVKAEAATFLLPNMLPLREAKTVAMIVAMIVAEIADAAAIRIVVATIVAHAATLTIVANVAATTRLARPHLPIQPKNRLCCPASHWPSIAAARFPKPPPHASPNRSLTNGGLKQMNRNRASQVSLPPAERRAVRAADCQVGCWLVVRLRPRKWVRATPNA